jgi:hypothetical protein
MEKKRKRMLKRDYEAKLPTELADNLWEEDDFTLDRELNRLADGLSYSVHENSEFDVLRYRKDA